jgi:hypothetical protein
VGQVEQRELAFEGHDVRREPAVVELAVGHVGNHGDRVSAAGHAVRGEPKMTPGHRDLVG